MLTRFWAARRDDEGVALVMAMAMVAMSTVLIVTLISLAVREDRGTSHDRARAASITTAEGAVDAALAAIDGAGVSEGLPCGTSTASAKAAPDTVSITTEVTYYNAAGAVMACPLSEDQVAAEIHVRAVATTIPGGGGLRARRTFEALAALKPKFSTDLNKAIFGHAGITVANNFDLFGQNGPDADVYTNGDFSCTNNEHFRGSVLAPYGSITLSNTCLIDVNAYAKTGFTMSKGTVTGDVKVSAGPVNITGGTLLGKAYTTQSSTWCTNNPTKCTVQNPVRIPVPQAFPVLNGDAATIAQYQAAGYQVVTLTECDPRLVGSVGRWLEDNGATMTAPVLLQTPCRANFQSNAKTVKLNNDVAIFADRGIEITNSITVQSTTAGVKHQILFVHPYDFAARVSEQCSTLGLTNQTRGTGIALSNLVTMTADINQLLYSPCDIQKANQSTVYGQVYSGGVARIDNKTDAYYAPVSVIGVTSTKIVEYYNADLQYKREAAG